MFSFSPENVLGFNYQLKHGLPDRNAQPTEIWGIVSIGSNVAFGIGQPNVTVHDSLIVEPHHRGFEVQDLGGMTLNRNTTVKRVTIIDGEAISYRPDFRDTNPSDEQGIAARHRSA